MIKSTYNSGFTLIETIMYAVIFMIVVGGMMLFGIAMLTSSQKSDTRVEVADNTRFVLQKFQRILQGAQVVNSPAVGSSASSISVNTASTSGNPFVFDLSNGVIRLKIASQDPIPLTSSAVTVSNLTFQNYSFSTGTRNTIRVTGKIQSIDPYRPVSSSFDVFISVQ